MEPKKRASRKNKIGIRGKDATEANVNQKNLNTEAI